MKIGFFGAGKMAEGILQAIPDKGGVIMAEKVVARAAALRKCYGVTMTARVEDVVRAADVLFLAVRPQDVGSVADVVKPLMTAQKTLVSIVAGKTCKHLRAAFGTKCGLIRVMPNLALRVGEGMCAMCAAHGTRPRVVKAVAAILGGAGKTVQLKEADFDAVTALSGSGPAYFAYMEQAMMEGGVALGLKPAVARLLAEQTMYGTAAFLRASGMDLDAFMDGVCTKGGTTAAGMAKLGKPAFKRMVAATLAAAAARSRELGNGEK